MRSVTMPLFIFSSDYSAGLGYKLGFFKEIWSRPELNPSSCPQKHVRHFCFSYVDVSKMKKNAKINKRLALKLIRTIQMQ